MIDISESVMQFLLAFVVVGPLLGAAAALLPAPPGLKGKSPEQAVLRHGVTVTGVILAAAIVLALGFDHDHPSKMQASTDISWIPALDVRIHLGIDGISLPLVVLTALLTFLWIGALSAQAMAVAIRERRALTFSPPGVKPVRCAGPGRPPRL